MKRYKILDTSKPAQLSTLLIREDNDGEWVKFEDVEEHIQNFIKEYQNTATYLDTAVLYSDNVECNCEEEREKIIDLDMMIPIPFISRLFSHWICPAHGYKRL